MRPLITPKQLAPHLGRPGWLVLDCRHALADRDLGRRVYAEGHVPGSVFADMDHDLCGPLAPGSGRHPLPAWPDFCAWLGRQGARRSTRIVAYDQAGGAFAARLWWMLLALGHAHAAVLNGGFARWEREGYPTETAVPAPLPLLYRAEPDPRMVMALDELQAHLASPALLLVDARAGERYRGETEPIDPRPGHIPGAINLPYQDNLDGEGVFLSPARLRKRLLAAYGGTPPERTVHYCGSGVTACHNLLAHAVAGLPVGRLYAGSWSQWCADPARPAGLGPAPRVEKPAPADDPARAEPSARPDVWPRG